ncbi:MAG: alpha/beta fold hydrolase [Acidobacteria bacterium]|nr:alpha/beta fold hydrolase [Acidobacteriota bacterium]
MNPAGHLRTVGASLRRRWWPPPVPPSQPWEGGVDDPTYGRLVLSGRLSAGGRGDRLVMAIHGLGGCADSLYLWQLASSALAAGWSVLRLNLRGADRRGEDFYHGGLTADLHGALASPALAGYRDIALVGYSLGGHAALCYASEPGDERVRCVAAVCPPLDLATGQGAIDRPGAYIYRRYVLGHVKEIYREVAARREVPVPVATADGIATLLDWDEAIVSRRHGFAGAADYYARASVAPRLGELRLPALVLAAEGDPMVPVASLRSLLTPPAPEIEVRWLLRSGHVAFPRRLDLGYGPRLGLAGQVMAWLDRAVG